jgi:hypothetical protein
MALKTQKKDVASTVMFASKTLGETEVRQWIAEKAYGLYLNRGRIEGHDVEDWTEAEQRVLDELKPKVGPKLRAV